MLIEPINIPGNFIIDAIGEGLFGIDKNGICIFINAAAATMLGAGRDYFLGKDIHNLIHHQFEGSQPYPRSACVILETAKSIKGCKVADEVFWRTDGTSFHVRYTANPIIERDIVKGAVVTFSDITAQKIREQEILTAKTNLEAFINGTQDFIWSVDADLRIITINKAFADIMEKLEERTLKQGDYVVLDWDADDARKKWKGYYKRALNGESFSITDELFDPIKLALMYRAISFNPMYDAGGKIWGVACQSKDITGDTLNLLALEAAKTELDKIMDSSLDLICTVDQKGYFLNVSAASEAILGYRPDELIGKRMMDFVYEEDKETTLQAANKIMSGINNTNVQNRYVRKDGTLVSLSWSARWDPKDKIRYGIARDTTEMKKAETKLQMSERRFKSLVQEGADLIGILDADACYTYVSPASVSVLGIEPEYFIGKNAFEFIHPDDKETVLAASKRLLTKRQIKITPYRFLSAGGKWRWLETTITNLTDDAAINGLVVNSRDITERKLAEDLLKQSEAELAEAQRLAKMGSWHFDVKADRLTWSDELYNVFGADKKTFIETHGSFVSLVDASDRERVMQTSKHTQETGTPFIIEYRITTPGGEKKIIQEHGYGETDANGLVTRMFGTAQDITERKIAEEELKNSEEKYKYLFQNSPVPLIIWDFETFRIIECNIEAEIKYGYTREEFLQLTIKDIRPSEDIPLIESSAKNEGIYGQIHKKTWRHKKKNGELMFMNITGHLMDYNGRRVSLALSEDITESRYYNQLDLLEKGILESKAANEKSLKEVIEDYLLGIEALHPGMLCSLQELHYNKLYNSASPSLPAAFLDAIEGIEIGKSAGSCGTAAFFKKKIIVADVQSDIRWADYKAIAAKYELKACWSQPILDDAGNVMATFACYFREIKTPSAFEEKTIQRASHLLQVILESDQREKALRISNERFEYVTEATSDIIWDWNLETNGVHYSGNMYKLFGHKPGINYNNLPFYYDHVHPEDRDKVVLYPDAVKNGTFIHWTQEYRFRKADGEYAFVLDKGIVIRDEKGKGIRMVGAMRDITKQKNEELALEESEKRYSELFHLSPQPMWVYDYESLQFLDVNNAAIKHYGYSRKEFLSMTIKDIRPPSELPKLEETVAANKKLGLKNFQGVFTHQKKNGEVIQVDIQSNFVRRKGRKAKVVLANDVTERLNYIRAIEAQNEKLKEISWIQSHIVRAPLARIMGLIPLISDAENKEEHEKMLQSILLSANELDVIIGNITDKTKITDI